MPPSISFCLGLSLGLLTVLVPLVYILEGVRRLRRDTLDNQAREWDSLHAAWDRRNEIAEETTGILRRGLDRLDALNGHMQSVSAWCREDWIPQSVGDAGIYRLADGQYPPDDQTVLAWDARRRRWHILSYHEWAGGPAWVWPGAKRERDMTTDDITLWTHLPDSPEREEAL